MFIVCLNWKDQANGIIKKQSRVMPEHFPFLWLQFKTNFGDFCSVEELCSSAVNSWQWQLWLPRYNAKTLMAEIKAQAYHLKRKIIFVALREISHCLNWRSAGCRSDDKLRWLKDNLHFFCQTFSLWAFLKKKEIGLLEVTVESSETGAEIRGKGRPSAASHQWTQRRGCIQIWTL